MVKQRSPLPYETGSGRVLLSGFFPGRASGFSSAAGCNLHCDIPSHCPPAESIPRETCHWPSGISGFCPRYFPGFAFPESCSLRPKLSDFFRHCCPFPHLSDRSPACAVAAVPVLPRSPRFRTKPVPHLEPFPVSSSEAPVSHEVSRKHRMGEIREFPGEIPFLPAFSPIPRAASQVPRSVKLWNIYTYHFQCPQQSNFHISQGACRPPDKKIVHYRFFNP